MSICLSGYMDAAIVIIVGPFTRQLNKNAQLQEGWPRVFAFINKIQI